MKNNQTIHTHGGARPGAGRKPGTGNRSSEEARRKAAETGETPLDYMLRVQRDPSVGDARRDDMAKAAAPYVHARLASTEVKAETTVRYVARVPDKSITTEQWNEQHVPATH